MVTFDIDEMENTQLSKWMNVLVQPLDGQSQTYVNVSKRNQYMFMIMASLMTQTHNNLLDVLKTTHERCKDKAKSNEPKIAVKQTKRTQSKYANTEKEAPSKYDEFGIPLLFENIVVTSSIKVPSLTFEWSDRQYWEIRLESIKNLELIKKQEEESKNPPAKEKPGSKINKKAAANAAAAAPTRYNPRNLQCSYHRDNKCPYEEPQNKLGKCLDNQFKYLITLASECPAATKPRIAVWLDALSSIDDTSCVIMKSIRNDYMMLLLGYVFHDEIKGPFEMPPVEPLEPLGDLIASYNSNQAVVHDKKSAPKRLPLNPVGDTIEAFMNTVPRIEEGAFALLSITGNFFDQSDDYTVANPNPHEEDENDDLNLYEEYEDEDPNIQDEDEQDEDEQDEEDVDENEEDEEE
jgi:hypothetical protein